ncbi:MAG: anti-sigma factor family protein [Gemmatimonadales bacterium]
MNKRAKGCAETLKHLDDYLDRELSPKEIAEVEAHLAECSDCHDEFSVERELLDCVREKLRHLRVPADLMKRIAARIAEE